MKQMSFVRLQMQERKLWLSRDNFLQNELFLVANWIRRIKKNSQNESVSTSVKVYQLNVEQDEDFWLRTLIYYLYTLMLVLSKCYNNKYFCLFITKNYIYVCIGWCGYLKSLYSEPLISFIWIPQKFWSVDRLCYLLIFEEPKYFNFIPAISRLTNFHL